MLGLICSLGACDYLDYYYNTGTNKTQEEAYSYFENLNSLVGYVYSCLPYDFGTLGGAMMESATDNSLYTWENSNVYDIVNGIWSPLHTIDNQWGLWNGIRAANSFLETYDPEVLKRFEFNDDYDEIVAISEKFPSEVRFLRAFFYFELAKRYKDIPLLTKTCSQEEVNSLTKTSFDEIINFIADECAQIAEDLPVNQGDWQGDYGRATKGAALALRSRALLYAASPLHNPNGDQQKWEAAAKAAYDVIKMGVYEMPAITEDPLYSPGDGNNVLQSKQLIFERRSTGLSNSFEGDNIPMGFEGAEGGNAPTQNLVDAYEMSDGTPFSWDNPDHVENMYYDSTGNPTRDPRLYLNVLVNGSEWQGVTIETFEGGRHNVLANSTPTGYYLRKYMNPNATLAAVNPVKVHHHYILFRYAEILLNYAEAMYEWKGDADAVDSECPLSARAALNQVRASANMNGVTVSGEQFKEKLRNERRIELAFEGHRFFDIRRWKIAGTDEVRNLYGVEITLDGSGFSYNRVLLRTMYWDDKMYLYPFPQNEVYINPNLTQNPGWEKSVN